MEDHFLDDEKLAAVKKEMRALEQQMDALRQRILNHFNTPEATRQRLVKYGFMNEDGTPSRRYADRGQWPTLEELWHRPV